MSIQWIYIFCLLIRLICDYWNNYSRPKTWVDSSPSLGCNDGSPECITPDWKRTPFDLFFKFEKRNLWLLWQDYLYIYLYSFCGRKTTSQHDIRNTAKKKKKPSNPAFFFFHFVPQRQGIESATTTSTSSTKHSNNAITIRYIRQ